jgi:hypothetical protein
MHLHTRCTAASGNGLKTNFWFHVISFFSGQAPITYAALHCLTFAARALADLAPPAVPMMGAPFSLRSPAQSRLIAIYLAHCHT